MAERKNTGIAVPNAKRLNDCYNELSEAIAARPAAKGDRDLWRYDYAALPGGPGGEDREIWNHRCGSRDVALVALRGNLTNGNLQLWTYGPHGEGKVDPNALKEPTLATFKSGTYQPDNRLMDSAGLADCPLWVKETDWRCFMADLWTVRYGIDWANPAPPADAPKLPPEGQFITLSHALTWIAFGVSMGNDHLHEVLGQDRFGKHDPRKAIAAALEKLVALAGSERMAVRGKYRATRDDDASKLDTAPIDPIKFADFRQFSYLEDELRHGNGLLPWHDGSGQIFCDVFGSGRKDCYAQVTVNRADLLRDFPPQRPVPMEGFKYPLGHTYTRGDPADIAPWWTINQALAWIASRIPSYVEYAGRLEAAYCARQQTAGALMAQVTIEDDMGRCDEASAFILERRATWPEGSVMAHAGRALLEKILAGEVAPRAREDGRGRAMQSDEFAGVGTSETGADWLDLNPQPLFSSAEILRAFTAEPIPPGAPARPVTSTAGAESECRDWLVGEFGADSDKQRTKSEFQAAALTKFSGRLSVRGFIRAWDAVAPQAGRSMPGRKP